ncbi:uncharacterized protein B0H18DRAFT_574712 [Fomitopsis serialis]|uniref:uncharacterized protein n=1 Tax=Fomitopsis serialis TaxID=139415 RepID=UPI00200771F0|nr:uncharacterized protein B0H18DRAFT_574712 [Neoantrodia serialis]KAH9921036.1 hypothetical protein B0H18DRAFT_574712 [Neoantrodia serialis]
MKRSRLSSGTSCGVRPRHGVPLRSTGFMSAMKLSTVSTPDCNRQELERMSLAKKGMTYVGLKYRRSSWNACHTGTWGGTLGSSTSTSSSRTSRIARWTLRDRLEVSPPCSYDHGLQTFDTGNKSLERLQLRHIDLLQCL